MTDAILMMNTWESAYASSYGKGGTPQDISDYFSVNAKSFPYTQPIRVKKGDVLRLRFYGAGDEFHEMHLHGHDMLITHKDGYPLDHPYYVDTISVGPGERYDAIVEMKNPGLFIMHDHVDKHMTNNGAMLGGPVTVIEYEGVKFDTLCMEGQGLRSQGGYLYSESLKQGYGLFNNTAFLGQSIEQTRRHR